MRRLPTFREVLDRFPALSAIADRQHLRSIPYVQQLSAAECGAACLAMVLKYYGKTVPLEELRDIAVSGRDATNAQTLIDTGRRYGLRGRAVALDLDQLEYLDRGAILHWEFVHFVIFERIGRDCVHVVDPKRGRRRVPMDQFKRSFTGVALLFEPDDHFQPGGRSGTTVARYLQQILAERGFVPHILVASVLLQAMGLTLPLLNRLLIDRVIPHQDYHLLVVLATGMVFLTVFQCWTSMIRSYLLLYLRTRLNARMVLGFLEHLLALPFDFFQRRSTGDLLVRMGSNATVREILTGTVLSTVLDGTLAIGYLLLLLTISVPMAILASCIASVQIALFVFTRHRQRQFLAESLDASAKSHGYMVEMLSNVETLKALGAERRAVDHWSGLFATELNVSLRRGHLDAVLEALTSVVRMGASMTLLGVGAMQVMAGRLTLGDMMALIAVATGFVGPLLNLVSAATRLQLLVIYLERLNDVLQTPAERERTGTRAVGRLNGVIKVDNVSFRYGPVSPFVVRNVSAEIREGEFVALVGRSGSGKSTLARLLVGLYAPTEGCVYYDGVDLTQLDVVMLRRQIGVVTQQAQLFGGTIRSNIALTDPSLPLEAVIQAAKLAEIHDDIIAMPMAYDTLLIDRGGSLSGGQQQRVSLARALVSRPRILVLDEATSQLDATTERAVQQQLATLACTRVVIAHRLSTIMRADRIFVMDSGRIVEQGTHDELLARRGPYARLVAAQMTDDMTLSGTAVNP